MMLQWVNDVEGEKVLYKFCLLSAMEVLLENPNLNTQGHLFVDCSEDNPAIAFSPKAWFPQEKELKVLDIQTYLERAQDQPKPLWLRSQFLTPSFPMCLPPLSALGGLSVSGAWGGEPPTPHQLSEPEVKLLAAKTMACQELPSHLSMVSVLMMMRT